MALSYAQEQTKPFTNFLTVSKLESTHLFVQDVHVWHRPHLHDPPQKSRIIWQAFFFSFFAVCFIVVICGYRNVKQTVSPPMRRRLAEGQNEGDSEVFLTVLEDSCQASGPHSFTPPTEGAESEPPPREQAGAKRTPRKRKQKTSLRESHGAQAKSTETILEKKKRETSAEKRPKKRRRALKLAKPAMELPDPKLEAYITEALEGESGLELADWLLDPKQDMPHDLSFETEEPPLSPGEGTSASSTWTFQAAQKVQASQPSELLLSPGEGASTQKERDFQVKQKLLFGQPPFEGTGGGDTPGDEVGCRKVNCSC